MQARSIRRALVPTLLFVAFAPGCDPKLTGLEETGGGGTTETPEATVTVEATVIGSIVSFHNVIMAAGLSLAGDFDGSGSTLRSIGTACMTIASLETAPASYSLDLAGCSDDHGTAYTGTGSFEVGSTQTDGYTFFPDFAVEDMIRARNESDTGRNHDLHQGSMTFTFERNPSDDVTGVVVGNWIRHTVQGEVVTFAYSDVTFTGMLGSFNTHPDAGSTIDIAWNGIGSLQLTFNSNSTANYTIQGVLYQVNLTTAVVTIP
jgi:hypothetical protein